MKTALITGILGQDGRLLAEHLINLGYRVVGVVKPDRNVSDEKLANLTELVAADITDPSTVLSLLMEREPDEIYHLAAFHHSSQEHSIRANTDLKEKMLTHNFLSTRAIALATSQSQHNAHLVFAGSSQMFTPRLLCDEITENSQKNPATFYGLTKSWSTELLAFLRNESNLRASTAILFNHESHLRSPQFVSRKITQAAAHAKAGRSVTLKLLNIGARVDWCSARDVVCALHLMAKKEAGEDFVVASGKLHSVRDVLEIAFDCVGLDWRDYASYQVDLPEPALMGQSSLLRNTLGWRPHTSFKDMLIEMVNHDLRSIGIFSPN